MQLFFCLDVIKIAQLQFERQSLLLKKKSTDKGHRNHIVHPGCLIAGTLKISYIINKHISQTD